MRGIEEGLQLCLHHTCVLVGKSMTWRLEGFLDPARHEFAMVCDDPESGLSRRKPSHQSMRIGSEIALSPLVMNVVDDLKSLIHFLSTYRRTIVASCNEIYETIMSNLLRSEQSVGGALRPVASRLNGAALLSTCIKTTVKTPLIARGIQPPAHGVLS